MREFESENSYEECPCCGSVAFLKEEVEEPRTNVTLQQSIHFYSCSVCGHTKQREVVDTVHGAQVIESYDIDFIPLLSRRAEIEGRAVPGEIDDEDWTYFLGDEEVSQTRWRAEFKERKRAMQGILN